LKAAIIAGGLARRLRPITEEIPKALVEVAGKPIIEWQIEWLKKYGVDTIVILSGYRREKLIDRLGSGKKYGISIVYTVEDTPLGTAGALKNAEKVLQGEPFLVVNGDIITDINISELMKPLNEGNVFLMSIALVPLRSPYGIVVLDDNGVVKEFREKPMLHQHLINAGVYAMKPEIFPYIPEKGDLEKTTFPDLASQGRIVGVVYRESYWRSIDTTKDIDEATKELLRGH